MDPKPFKTDVPALHPATQLGPITIRVADLERSLRFYEKVIGLTSARRGGGDVPLGVEDEPPLILLQETPGARHLPRNSGLYHFAILLPTRADLGSALQRLIDSDVRIGQADHLVSEALYLSDPDGNGMEIYRDRPRAEWTWRGGKVEMAVDPLDLDSLLRDAAPGGSGAAPAGTTIGHIHLQVSDVQQAVQFYHGILGFDITAAFQGAAFLSAGGYHHHLGLNSWSSRGAPPAPPDAAGLESFSIRVPSKNEQGRIAERLKAAGVAGVLENGRVSVRDPWNIGIEILAA
ncbi:MAG: VOC family protein [Spirochaetia bacterium]|jgi:catechol 2,3-dioxygenase